MNDKPNSATPVPRASNRKRRRLSPLALIPLALVSIFAILSTLLAGYEFIYSDRVILGVSVLGQSMSGLARADIKPFLQNKFGNPDAILARFGGEAIVVRDSQRVWRAYPWELGLRTDFGPVAESAIALGHHGSGIERLIEQARCMWFGCDLGTDAQFDLETARAYLSWIAPQVERPARDASVRIEGLRVVSTPAQNGRALDGESTLERMQQRILGTQHSDITLAFRETAPLVSDASAVAAKTQAETTLAAPTLLTFNNHVWALDQATLAGMISIRPKTSVDGKTGLVVSIDHAQVIAFFKTLAGEIDQAARDARFHFDPANGSLTPTAPSQYGQLLNPELAAQQLEQQLFANAGRTPGNPSLSEAIPMRTLTLPVTVTKPTIAMEDAAKFGIKELVSQGVSNFKGSAAGRIQNIRTTTAAIDGIVVAPGAVFSFDQYLPEVVEANGYDDAYIIFADRTVLGPGGGVCQVSSTVFRAAFFGGFPIVERWAHAYRVGYYEPPAGLDATVFAPSVDLKFKNDTDTYLLIQPKLDLRTTTLTFNFYGTKPNRTVEMEEPIMERIIPHGPAIYTDDPSLKKGTTKQIDFAHDGADVTVWRKITVNGQVKRDKFFSRYDPWVARYAVGTKVVK